MQIIQAKVVHANPECPNGSVEIEDLPFNATIPINRYTFSQRQELTVPVDPTKPQMAKYRTRYGWLRTIKSTDTLQANFRTNNENTIIVVTVYPNGQLPQQR